MYSSTSNKPSKALALGGAVLLAAAALLAGCSSPTSSSTTPTVSNAIPGAFGGNPVAVNSSGFFTTDLVYNYAWGSGTNSGTEQDSFNADGTYSFAGYNYNAATSTAATATQSYGEKGTYVYTPGTYTITYKPTSTYNYNNATNLGQWVTVTQGYSYTRNNYFVDHSYDAAFLPTGTSANPTWTNTYTSTQASSIVKTTIVLTLVPGPSGYSQVINDYMNDSTGANPYLSDVTTEVGTLSFYPTSVTSLTAGTTATAIWTDTTNKYVSYSSAADKTGSTILNTLVAGTKSFTNVNGQYICPTPSAVNRSAAGVINAPGPHANLITK